MRKLLSIAATLALAGAFAVAQDQSSQPSSSNPDQSSAQSQQQTTPDQSANPSSGTSTPDQNASPSSSSSSSADQNAAGTSATSDQNAPANGKKLPQTASPLPLLGLLGVGSLAAGVISRRKK